MVCTCAVCKSDNSKDKRLRTSILIRENGKTIVVDSGPDFRQQMLTNNVNNLDAIVFTHEHKDHIAGLDDVRPYNLFLKKDIEIFASPKVQEALKREFHYVFSGVKYPGIPQINLNTIENKPFNVCGVNFKPIEVLHYKLPVFGYRIGDFSYITDANYISGEEKKKLAGTKVLVLNALRRKKHISHFTLDEAVSLVEEIKPEKAYFTHISHQLGKHEDVEKELPNNIFLAYDGLTLEL
jgi:phosphoribosyl 1,2-cyclic phosphate phosphodiesterase